jgi:hypothetical protein
MDGINRRVQPDRSKINLDEEFEVQQWAKHFKIDRDRLHALVEKVGNSAAAVRKELTRDL